MKSKTHLFLLVCGYISSSLVYLIWYYKIWHYSQYENVTDIFNKEVITVLVGITALYLFLYYLILSIRSFQTPWKSFVLVLITTLLTFFLIPTVYYAKYQFIKAEEKIYTEKNRMKKMEAKLNNLNAENNAAKKYI
jgi:glucan phosphoethanolaminetransferase (alkaline phosphatase superfamily)